MTFESNNLVCANKNGKKTYVGASKHITTFYIFYVLCESLAAKKSFVAST